MYYNQEIVEEVRMQNDIVDVISQYLPLKQKGSSYFGLCPFHNEQTASFSVSAEKQLYYCFGCGVAGNVFSFIMQAENCDFVEAVQRLADRVHIDLPTEVLTEEDLKEERLKEKLYEIHVETGRFYHEALISEKGKIATEYLKKRGVSLAVIKKFGLGYAPKGRDLLYKYLLGKGFKETEMTKSGLVMRNKNDNGYHDRFYDRLMFPIFDVMGKPIAFGGRTMGLGEPKYLNSPETPLFNKKRTLYGLNYARMSKNKEIILVEGYMDVISIYQAGYRNVSASLGTAFNAEHAKVLKKFATDAILVFDSDEAGTNAALRAIPILIAGGFRVKVLQVINAKDPDEFIKKWGAREFGKLLINAKNHISFQISCVKKNYNLENIQHKVMFTTEVSKILSKVESAIEREVYAKEVAKAADVSKESIINEVDKLINKNEFDYKTESNKIRFKPLSVSKKMGIQANSKGLLEAQRIVLYTLSSEKYAYKQVKKVIAVEDFSEDVYARLFCIVTDMNEKGNILFPAEAVNYFETVEEQKLISEIFTVKNEYENIRDLEKALNEGIKLIKSVKIDKMTASANTVEDIKFLLSEKKKLDELSIKL